MTPAELAKKRGESTASDLGVDLNRDAVPVALLVLRPRAPRPVREGLRRRSSRTSPACSRFHRRQRRGH